MSWFSFPHPHLYSCAAAPYASASPHPSTSPINLLTHSSCLPLCQLPLLGFNLIPYGFCPSHSIYHWTYLNLKLFSLIKQFITMLCFFFFFNQERRKKFILLTINHLQSCWAVNVFFMARQTENRSECLSTALPTCFNFSFLTLTPCSPVLGADTFLLQRHQWTPSPEGGHSAVSAMSCTVASTWQWSAAQHICADWAVLGEHQQRNGMGGGELKAIFALDPGKSSN